MQKSDLLIVIHMLGQVVQTCSIRSEASTRVLTLKFLGTAAESMLGHVGCNSCLQGFRQLMRLCPNVHVPGQIFVDYKHDVDHTLEMHILWLLFLPAVYHNHICLLTRNSLQTPSFEPM